MSGLWVKIAVLVIVVLGAVFVVSRYIGSRGQEQGEPKTFHDVIAEDDAKLRAEPNKVVELPGGERVELEFRELEVEEQADAERLFEMALAQRKMGRLPGVGYKEMVDYCRMIIERYSGSEYAYKAKRMLGEVPKQYWDRYGISEEEVYVPQ